MTLNNNLGSYIILMSNLSSTQTEQYQYNFINMLPDIWLSVTFFDIIDIVYNVALNFVIQNIEYIEYILCIWLYHSR